MKIGILTFHCAHNYGAVLQCCALQETLKAMGHKVEIIDYRPKYLLNPYKKIYWRRFVSRNPFKLLKKCCKELLVLRRRIIRYNAFDKFISTKLNLSEMVTHNSIPSHYDIYIMGSDQIWNPKITCGFDPVYFGLFNFEKGSKKYIAYAASMEASSLTQEDKDFYLKALDNFDAISVREQTLADLLQPLTSKKIETVLDPTMLTDAKIWDSIEKRPFVDYKYVLVYQVRYDINTSRIAQNIADQIGAKVIEIAAGIKTWKYKKNLYTCSSPEEFLGWIKHASCIVTTSFHGTAFSVIFNKPFYCVKLGRGDTRAASLLQDLGLENRMIEMTASPEFQLVDYHDAIVRLDKLKKKSFQYFNTSLNL